MSAANRLVKAANLSSSHASVQRYQHDRLEPFTTNKLASRRYIAQWRRLETFGAHARRKTCAACLTSSVFITLQDIRHQHRNACCYRFGGVAEDNWGHSRWPPQP
jgi:hypothetical protein